jgi:hypothetical protein
VIGAGVLLVLAAGCAQQAGSAAGGGSLTTSTPGSPPVIDTSGATNTPVTVTMVPGPPPGAPHLPPGAVPVPGNRVDAHALPSSFPRQVWTEKGGTVLGLLGEEGGCFTAKAVVDEQTGSRVTVRLIQHRPGPGPQACPMFLRYKPLTVTLAAPLGQREVRLLMSIVQG